MKFIIKDEGLEKGKCFICKNNCDSEAYCHLSCADALKDRREKKYKEAQEYFDKN